jgi:hypothetical protein
MLQIKAEGSYEIFVPIYRTAQCRNTEKIFNLLGNVIDGLLFPQ